MRLSPGQNQVGSDVSGGGEEEAGLKAWKCRTAGQGGAAGGWSSPFVMDEAVNRGDGCGGRDTGGPMPGSGWKMLMCLCDGWMEGGRLDG